MKIRPLAETDDRSAFSSGDAELDRFFARFAGQNQWRHYVGVTYVAVDDTAGLERIVGYATVSPAHIELAALPPAARKKLPRYPLPVLRLARLAVDQSAQGTGVGAALLRFVLGLALRTSEELGCTGVVVDAKPGAVAFYARFGFVPLDVVEGASEARPRPTPMFLSTSTIRAARGG